MTSLFRYRINVDVKISVIAVTGGVYSDNSLEIPLSQNN
jgi:hypothetical protein